MEITAFTHSGLKSAFNKELVKTGKVSLDDGILFNKLFNLRQEADYEDFLNMEEAEIEALLPKINGLIVEIENLINTEN